ncbi:putative quinol monooxygenase [Pseudomonas sp. UBA6323]|uniref:putative quinol monooxygenase n=1 Tax=Pseudomonas sp. UBA6323 TaxID=1947329 RepID=UPI0025D82A60|nr:putative quinol monooxygenase [Pseudomonas sp. UBA6323]
MTSALTLIATINVLPGHAEAVAAGLQALVTASRTEPGCLQYALHRNQQATDQFVMIEQWRDAEALDQHRATTHFLHFTHAFGERLIGVDLLPLQRIA